MWEGFHSWLEDNHHEDLPYLNVVVFKMKELHDDLCQSRPNEVIQNESCVVGLVGLIRASREGNWQLYLNAIHCMIPWCFAYDRQNHARYLPIYYDQMTSLPKDHPFSYEHLNQGGSSVQRSEHNLFMKVPID